MPEVKKSGGQNWWAMRENQYRDGDNNTIYREVFRNMATGEVVAPENGWNGAPPNHMLGDGCMAHLRHDGFAAGYDQVNWDGGRVDVPPDTPQRVISDSNFRNNFDTIQWNDHKGS